MRHHRSMPRHADPPPSLAARLRRETAALHAAAERAQPMAALIDGTIEREDYLALLASLQPIYRALEAALSRQAADARLDFARAPGLARRAFIAEDLAALAGDHPAPRAMPAAERYAEHLAALGATQPLCLAAHAYVRYLGDLHGGQHLARVVRTRFARADGAGTRCYDFGPPASLPARITAFRAGLDALPASAADSVVAEACGAFERHLELFAELERGAA
jgi:heme oxygenase